MISSGPSRSSWSSSSTSPTSPAVLPSCSPAWPAPSCWTSTRVDGREAERESMLLEPLGSEECGTLVANLLADDSVDEGVRARIAEAAEGIPLYAEEITGLLVDEGRLGAEGRSMGRDRGPLRHAGPPDDLRAAGGPAGHVACRRAAGDRDRLGDGTGLLPGAVHALADSGADEVGPGSPPWSESSSCDRSAPTFPRSEALAFRHLLIRDAAYQSMPKHSGPSCTSRSRTGSGDESPAKGSADRRRSSGTTSSRRTAIGRTRTDGRAR